mmetsp:Transcript_32000/g.66776  ORF Transcript_32000/g.66776 Transcript_32000/m.66776 type:complete len:88 (+) Transcript_32000:256-519(+)
MAVCGIRPWPNCVEKALRFMFHGLAVEERPSAAVLTTPCGIDEGSMSGFMTEFCGHWLISCRPAGVAMVHCSLWRPAARSLDGQMPA